MSKEVEVSRAMAAELLEMEARLLSDQASRAKRLEEFLARDRLEAEALESVRLQIVSRRAILMRHDAAIEEAHRVVEAMEVAEAAQLVMTSSDDDEEDEADTNDYRFDESLYDLAVVGGLTPALQAPLPSIAELKVMHDFTNMKGSRLEYLDLDTLRLIVDRLKEDDAFAFSSVCRIFRALTLARFPEGIRAHPRWAVQSVVRLQWALNTGYMMDSDTCLYAAEGGHLEVLKWARTNGCEWDEEETCSSAARGGYFKLLKWARTQGCDWDKQTCNAAARGGHLKMLKWVKARGCEWDVGTCSCAARGGHLNVLKWARANGCEWDMGTCVAARTGGHQKVLRWALANGCDPDPVQSWCVSRQHGYRAFDDAWMRW